VCPQSVKLQASSTQSNGPFDAGCLATTNLSWLCVIWYFFYLAGGKKGKLFCTSASLGRIWEAGGVRNEPVFRF